MAVRGGAALLAAQACVVTTQVVYAAVASRLLPPAAFGAFAVAISLTGLVPLLAAVGLPSLVLSEADLTPERASAINVIAFLGGVVGLLLTVAAAPLWSLLWHAPAAIHLTRWLGLQVAIAAPASVQLALLRREGRYVCDAAVQAGAAMLSAAIGLIVIDARQTAGSLLVSPFCSMALTGVASCILRRERYAWSVSRDFVRLLTLTRKLGVQNALFYLFTNIPAWAVSLSSGPSTLGQYSRTSTMSGLSSTAITTALTRATQSFYRTLESVEGRRMALHDSTVVASALVYPIFFALAIASPLVTRLWLGPGWEQAGTLGIGLAISFGVYATLIVLSNGAEMLREFDAVRTCQRYMLIPAVAVAGVVLLTRAVFLAPWMILTMALVGIVTLASALARRNLLHPMNLHRDLFMQAVFAVGGASAAFVTSSAAGALWPVFEGRVLKVCTMVLCAAFVAVATLPLQPAWGVMKRRGLAREAIYRDRLSWFRYAKQTRD